MDVADEPQVRVEERPPAAPGLGAWWALGGVVLVGLLIARAHLLWGAGVVSAALVLAAVCRAVVPQSQAGGLVVRGRVFDTAALLVLAGAVLLSAVTLDLTPR